jgi:hypothetical protein
MHNSPLSTSVQITYSKMSDLVLTEISLGHERPATDTANAVLSQMRPTTSDWIAQDRGQCGAIGHVFASHSHNLAPR